MNTTEKNILDFYVDFETVESYPFEFSRKDFDENKIPTLYFTASYYKWDLDKRVPFDFEPGDIFPIKALGFSQMETLYRAGYLTTSKPKREFNFRSITDNFFYLLVASVLIFAVYALYRAATI